MLFGKRKGGGMVSFEGEHLISAVEARNAPSSLTGTACGRLRSPACAQRSLLPPSPHPPPNALYAGGWTPRYNAGQSPLPVPRQNGPNRRLSDKEAQPMIENAEGLCPPRFMLVISSQTHTAYARHAIRTKNKKRKAKCLPLPVFPVHGPLSAPRRPATGICGPT